MHNQPDTLETLTETDLAAATGGLDVGSLVSGITSKLDGITGGKASQVANGVMGIVNSFTGGGGGEG
jgi:hypothetical protein